MQALYFFVGADGFEPPKSKDSRFTVCPIWPLWKTPFLRFTGAKVHIFLDKRTKGTKNFMFLCIYV